MTPARIALATCLGFSPVAHAQTTTQLAYACKSFVEALLHDPRSADLSEWTTASAARNKAGNWVVRFGGRATNGFNATRRVTFECVIKFTPPDSAEAVNVRTL